MAKEKKQEQTIEEALAAIEAVVEKLESGDIDLEEAIRNYEKGMQLIEKCNEVLKQSRLKVEMLKKKAEKNTADGKEKQKDSGEGLF